MAKIEKGKPLPSHTNLDYDECWAKLVLEKMFPNRYVELQIKDKPDLQDVVHKVGIEVTSAVSQNNKEILALGTNLHYGLSKNQARDVERIEQLGGTYKNGFLCGCGWNYKENQMKGSPYEVVTESFKKKIKKLNSGQYDALTQYDLFIYAEFFAENAMLQKVVDEFNTLNCGERSFRYVYLLTIENIVIFDLNALGYHVQSLENILDGLGFKARQMVEAGETNDNS